jgi:hypothetical protein
MEFIAFSNALIASPSFRILLNALPKTLKAASRNNLQLCLTSLITSSRIRSLGAKHPQEARSA